MTRQYRASHPAYVAIHGADVFDADFTAAEEADWVNRGLLELVPRRYKVVGPHTVHGTAPGETFVRAMRLDEDAALVAGGHVVHVGGPLPEPDPDPEPPKSKRKRAAPKE